MTTGLNNNDGYRSLDNHYLSPKIGKGKVVEEGSIEEWTSIRHVKNVIARIVQSILRMAPDSLLKYSPELKNLVNDKPLNDREMLSNLNANIDLLVRNWTKNPAETQVQLEKIQKCVKNLKQNISDEQDLIVLSSLSLVANKDIVNSSPEDQQRIMKNAVDVKDTDLAFSGLSRRIHLFNKD